MPNVMELRRQSCGFLASGFLDRFSNLPWNCIVKHVSNVRNPGVVLIGLLLAWIADPRI